jgi:hypothetical protein
VKLPGGPFSAQKISGMADMGLGRDYNRIGAALRRHEIHG